MSTINSSLVSIIIPCYNAGPWVAETLDSALAQTHRPLEIIVIDDGSTDDSLAVIKRYAAQHPDLIRYASGPNRGGNAARNRGFALSQGQFIQYLDADDYLLPDKITRQVEFLSQTGADVVYGDWRHQFHTPDGGSYLGEIAASEHQSDVLASLLAGWWVASLALLHRRCAVLTVGGWDETLTAAQDRDFFTQEALHSMDIRYQPGCHAIYRRYGSQTVSTGNRNRWLANHLRVSAKAEDSLAQQGRLLGKYGQALARSYFALARQYYEVDRDTYHHLMDKVVRLDPTFMPRQSRLYNTTWRIFGFQTAEFLASNLRRLRRLWMRLSHTTQQKVMTD